MSTLTRKLMRGEIYYIHSFPTCGHEQRSGRPAVIVSNNENNAHSEVVEICYLTLKEKNPLPTHIIIDRGPCMNSTVLCEQITSVAIDRIGDYMCKLPEELEVALDKALMASLNLLPITKVMNLSGHEVIEKVPDEVMAELTSLKHENTKLMEELALAKDANLSIKEKSVDIRKALDATTSRAEMYERMYNDLLDRLVSRGK